MPHITQNNPETILCLQCAAILFLGLKQRPIMIHKELQTFGGAEQVELGQEASLCVF